MLSDNYRQRFGVRHGAYGFRAGIQRHWKYRHKQTTRDVSILASSHSLHWWESAPKTTSPLLSPPKMKIQQVTHAKNTNAFDFINILFGVFPMRWNWSNLQWPVVKSDEHSKMSRTQPTVYDSNPALQQIHHLAHWSSSRLPPLDIQLQAGWTNLADTTTCLCSPFSSAASPVSHWGVYMGQWLHSMCKATHPYTESPEFLHLVFCSCVSTFYWESCQYFSLADQQTNMS